MCDINTLSPPWRPFSALVGAASFLFPANPHAVAKRGQLNHRRTLLVTAQAIRRGALTLTRAETNEALNRPSTGPRQPCG